MYKKRENEVKSSYIENQSTTQPIRAASDPGLPNVNPMISHVYTLAPETTSRCRTKTLYIPLRVRLS